MSNLDMMYAVLHGTNHTYTFKVLDEDGSTSKTMTVYDTDGDGTIDSFNSDETCLFIEHGSTAQELITLFKEGLPDQLSKARSRLGDTEKVRKDEGFRYKNSDVTVDDRNNDGFTDWVIFNTEDSSPVGDVHVSIGTYATSLEEYAGTRKGVNEYLSVFDTKLFEPEHMVRFLPPTLGLGFSFAIYSSLIAPLLNTEIEPSQNSDDIHTS